MSKQERDSRILELGAGNTDRADHDDGISRLGSIHGRTGYRAGRKKQVSGVIRLRCLLRRPNSGKMPWLSVHGGVVLCTRIPCYAGNELCGFVLEISISA